MEVVMPVRVASFLVSLALVSGCAETYCQSGPLYGTQCYSTYEIDLQRQNSRGESAPMRGATPLPACTRTTLADGAVIESADCIALRHALQQR
jgi:hypothetical protein